MNIAQQLDNLLKQEKISRTAFAKKIDVHTSTVSRWLSGYPVSAEGLQKLCEYYGCSMNYWTGEQEKSPTLDSAEHKHVDLSERGHRIGRLYDLASERDKRLVDMTLEPYEEQLQPSPVEEPQPRRVRRRSDGFVEIEVYVDQLPAAGYSSYFDAPRSRIEQYPREIVPPKATFGVVISGISMQPQYKDQATAFVESMPMVQHGEVGLFSLNGEPYIKQLIVDEERREIRLHSFNPMYEDIVVREFDDLRTFGRILGSY